MQYTNANQQLAELSEEAMVKEILELRSRNAMLERSLQQKEARFGIALRHVTITLAHVDTDLRYTWILNPPLDFKIEDCLGKKDVEIVQNAGTVELQQLKEEVLTTGVGMRREIIFPLPSGKSVYDITAEPLYDDARKIVGVSTAATDITFLKRMQKQLIESGKMASIGQLAMGVAHEFNNILATILATAQLVMAKNRSGLYVIPKSVEERIKTVIECGERGKVITRNLLELGKPTAPKKDLIDINLLIDQTLQMQAKELIEERVEVIRDYQSEEKMYLDQRQMEQVFLHMIKNAQHAIKVKGRGKIYVRVKKIADRMEISFADTGCGMNHDVQQKIFEPFFTTKGGYTKNTDILEGTGLGLSIAQQLVKSHGGFIEVESQEGKGSTFTINLPIR